MDPLTDDECLEYYIVGTPSVILGDYMRRYAGFVRSAVISGGLVVLLILGAVLIFLYLVANFILPKSEGWR
jgi:hypothetical protein